MTQRCVRALRGATTVEADDPEFIRAATVEVVAELLARNGLRAEDIISALFTVTSDLGSENPARAAREIAGLEVPMLCVPEMTYADSLPRCIRLMLHVDIATPSHRPIHVYLAEAQSLRPDLG